jgi:hypothetical protein
MLNTIFTFISLLTLYLFYLAIKKQNKLVLFLFWQSCIGCIAFLDIFKTTPLLFPIAIIITTVFTLVLLKQIDTQQLNKTLLLSIHIIRVPVELMLFQLFLNKKIPELMTFKGWNFDIIVGISAIVLVAYQLLTRKLLNKYFLITWNIAGLMFLSIIVTLAILSSPLPIQQFAFNQPNIAVLEFPYCFLPTCIVPIVLMSHTLLLRNTKKLTVNNNKF